MDAAQAAAIASDCAAVGLAVLAPSGTIIHANRAFGPALGRGAEGLVGSLLGACLHSEDGSRLLEGLQAALASPDVPVALTVRALAPSGERRRVRLRLTSAERAAEPALVCVVDDAPEAALADVRPSSLDAPSGASAANAKDVPRLDGILASISDGVFTLDSRDWTYGYVNPAAARMVGRTHEGLTGRRIWDEFPEGIGSAYDLAYRRVAAEGVPLTVLDHYEPLDVWLEANIYPMAGGVTVYCRDVTRQKRAEVALQESEARFRALMEQAADAIFIADEDANYLDVNPAACALVGYSRDELLRMNVSDLLLDPVAEGLAEEMPVIRSGTESRRGWRMRRKDGTGVDIEASTKRLSDGRVLGVVRDVTRQRRLESDLRSSLARLRNVMDSLFGFVGIYSLDGTLLDANAAPLEAAGLSREDVLGKKFWDTYWWSYSSTAQEQVKDALARAARGKVVRYETPVRVGEGRFIDIDVVFSPVRDPDGHILETVGFAVDVTERNRAVAALRENEAVFRGVFEHVASGIVQCSLDGRFLRANRSFCEIVGYEPEELRGMSVRDITPSEELRRDPSLLEELLLGRIPTFSVERRYRRKDGALVWVSVMVSLRRDARGEPLELLGVVDDITTRRRTEEALRDRERRLSTVFHGSSDAMILLAVEADSRLRLVAANRAFLRRLNLSEREEPSLVGLALEELMGHLASVPPPELVAEYLEKLRQVIESRKPITLEHSVEFPIGMVTSEATFVPVMDDTGACRYVLWTSRDMTARHHAEVQLRAALAEKETLLREIHHRVKNNMQIVSSLLGLQGSHAGDALLAERFRVAQDRIRSMALVHERLYSSKSFAALDLAGHIASLVQMIAGSHRDRADVRVRCEIPPILVGIDEAVPLGLAVNELVSNAFKHAFAPGGSGNISVVCQQRGSTTVLTVQDDGVGLPPDFEMATARSLGLRLVRTLAGQLQGTFELRSGRGAQAVLTVVLGGSHGAAERE